MFMKNQEMPYTEFLVKQIEMDKVLPYARGSLDLDERDAIWLFRNMCIYTLGMASLFVNSTCIMTEEENA